MAMHALIEDFTGDPQELYNLVVEEINRRQLPGFAYSWIEETEFTKLLSKGAKANALLINFRGFGVRVLGYQVGSLYHVSLRTTTTPHITDQASAGFLRQITDDVYLAVVNRALKAALRRQLEARQKPIPKELDLAGIFLTPDETERTQETAS